MSLYNEPWDFDFDNPTCTEIRIIDRDGSDYFEKPCSIVITITPWVRPKHELRGRERDISARIVRCVNACAHLSDATMAEVASGKLTLIPADTDDLPVMD